MKIDKNKLRYTLIGGGLNHKTDVGISNRFLGDSDFEASSLSIGDLALLSWEDRSEIYLVKKVGKKYARVEKTNLIVQHNKILSDYRKKLRRGEVPKYTINPKGSRMDLVEMVGGNSK